MKQEFFSQCKEIAFEHFTMFGFAYEEAVIGTANQISYTRLKTHNYLSAGKKTFYATPFIIFCIEP